MNIYKIPIVEFIKIIIAIQKYHLSFSSEVVLTSDIRVQPPVMTDR